LDRWFGFYILGIHAFFSTSLSEANLVDQSVQDENRNTKTLSKVLIAWDSEKSVLARA
jgi:hypothetical protein